METRPSTPGWCPSVRAVLDKEWWPGKFIYDGQTYTDKNGVEQVRLMALCPSCGKWVPIHDGDMVGHQLPAGSDIKRLDKAREAKDAYGKIVAREAMRAMSVAS